MNSVRKIMEAIWEENIRIEKKKKHIKRGMKGVKIRRN